MAREGAWMESSRDGDGAWLLTALGRWDLKATGGMAGELEAFTLDGQSGDGQGGAVRLDLSRLDVMDTVGAYLLASLADRLAAAGHAVSLAGIRPEHAALFDAVRQAGRTPAEPTPAPHPILDMLDRTGRTTVDAVKEGLDLL